MQRLCSGDFANSIHPFSVKPQRTAGTGRRAREEPAGNHDGMLCRREPPEPGFSSPEPRYFGQERPPRHRTRMSNARTFTGSAEINAMVARVAPAVLGLLADGTPRTKAAIVEALAGRLRATHHATTRLGQPSFPP